MLGSPRGEAKSLMHALKTCSTSVGVKGQPAKPSFIDASLVCMLACTWGTVCLLPEFCAFHRLGVQLFLHRSSLTREFSGNAGLFSAAAAGLANAAAAKQRAEPKDRRRPCSLHSRRF